MFQKAFSKIWILVIVAVIIASGVLAWQYLEKLIPKEQPPEDESINWQTYHNEEYGYTVKYPLGYKILDPENLENIVFANIKEEQIQREKRAGEFTSFVIRIHHNDKKLGLQEWLDENLSIYTGIPPNKDWLVDFNDIFVDGANGLQFTLQSMGWPRHTLILKNDLVIDINVGVIGDKKAYDYYSQMLSTFRFLD